MKEIKFNTANEMINWLMDNEGKELGDNYGRRWKYECSAFYFKDIGLYSKYWKKRIRCLHLFNTELRIIN